MARIIRDVVKPHQYDEDDRSATLLRVFGVVDLNSSSRIAGDAILAVDSVTGQGVPRPGEAHETMTDFVVRRVSVKPMNRARSQVYVFVWYNKTRRRLLDVRMNSVTVNTTTVRDKDGRIIIVGYKPPTGNKSTDPATQFPSPTKNNGWDYDYGEVPMVLPMVRYEVVYLENVSPLQNIDLYQARLNQKAWMGASAREWFCESIMGQVDSPIPTNLGKLGNPAVVTGKDAEFNWVTTYTFMRNKKPNPGGSGGASPGWDPLVLFTDLNTGRKPTDINPVKGGWPTQEMGNGWVVAKVYGEADFGDLKLVEAR